MASYCPPDLVAAEISRETYFAVQEVLCDSLNLDDASDCILSASIMDDLGAESIDWIDIVFRLEKKLGLEIYRDELFPNDIFTNREWLIDAQGRPFQGMSVNAARLTSGGLQALRKHVPWLDLEEFERAPIIENYDSQLTVLSLCRYVEFKTRN